MSDANPPSGKRKVALATVAGVLLVAAVLIPFLRTEDPDAIEMPTGMWCYDLETKTLFAAPIDSVPPFKNAQGHESVIAVVFSCKTGCEGKNLTGKTVEQVEQMGLSIGYLQRLSETARRGVEDFKKAAPSPDVTMMQCLQKMAFEGEYREPKGMQWLPMRSQTFVQLGAAIESRCSNAVQCKP